MTALAFPTLISLNSYSQRQHNLWQANFGDNYTQEVAQGINWSWDLWTVEWTPLNSTDMQTLIANLDAGTTSSLTWQPPTATASQNFKTVPKTMQVKPQPGGYFVVSVQLRQVP